MMKLSELETFERFVDAARPNFSGKIPEISGKVFSDLGIYHCGGVAQRAPTLSCFRLPRTKRCES
jgi:hypothetical protein